MDNITPSLTDLVAIAKSLNLSEPGVRVTVDLLDEGNTVPFITRYRKDKTGGLDEQQIRQIHDAVSLQRQLNERKQKILKSIQSQEKLTDELKEQILSATSNKVLEDLYLPYKPRKQSLANIARQRGLEPVAQNILSANPVANDLEAYFQEFVNEAAGLATVHDVESGVQHLLAEYFAEQVDLRELTRRHMWDGKLNSKRMDTPVDSDDDDDPNSDAETTEPSVDNAASIDLAQPAVPASGEAIAAQQVDTADDKVTEESKPDAPAVVENAQVEEPADAEGSNPQNESAGNADRSDTTDDTTTDDTTAETAKESGTVEPAISAGEKSSGQAPDSPEITMAPGKIKAVTATTETISTAADSTKSKKSGKTVAQTKAELARQRREMRRDARHRKRQKLEQSFKDYFDFVEQLKKLPHHRVLALNRGDRSKVLRVRIEFDANKLKTEAESKFINDTHPHAVFLRPCLADALSRLVAPSIDREIRRDLTDKAETHAVTVFAQNLRKLLLQPPLRGRRVLAVDPGFKSGCKLVAMDEFGNVLDHCLVHVIGSAQRVEESRNRLAAEINKHNIKVVAIGNGTACRETEQMVAQTLSDSLIDHEVGYLIVNEAGASVYSTSPIGREELPKFDATVRGAVSIGRRTLDPLSELVKIDPANIGVGLYQHDVKAKHLQDSLDAVVESCVNYVGVDVNSASPALLGYVSGLNQLTARRVYEYRLKNGPFKNREELKKVPGVGDATFVQAAGFLKISDGDNPLDRTWIHPESYVVAEKVLEAIDCDLAELAAPASAPTPPATADVPSAPLAKTDEGSLNGAQKANESPVETEDDAKASMVEPTPESTTSSEPVSVETASEPTPEMQNTSLPSDTVVAETVSSEVVETETPDSVAESVSDTVDDEHKSQATKPADERPADESENGQATPTTEPPAQLAEPAKAATSSRLSERLKSLDVTQLSEQLDVGSLLLKDILSSLARPGRDPRDDLPAPLFRRGVVKLEDLSPGMELTGTVLNVVDFGAFVDIGLSDSGLVHVSRLSEKFVNDPHEVVSVGDVLHVWVIDVDTKRRRVSLTAIQPGTETERPTRKPRQQTERPERSKDRNKERSQGQGRGQKRRDRGGKGGARQQSTWKPKAKPKPVVPITDAMAKGKEPMRTFSDLQQFYKKKKTDDGKDTK